MLDNGVLLCYNGSTPRKGKKMNRYKKEQNEKIIANAWREVIATRGYFDYWLDYEDCAIIVQFCFPTISHTFIKKIFWKSVFPDKNFLAKYEY